MISDLNVRWSNYDNIQVYHMEIEKSRTSLGSFLILCTQTIWVSNVLKPEKHLCCQCVLF